MFVNVADTPNAVVVCVILFNAAFGYRFVAIGYLSVESLMSTVGDLFRGYTHPKYVGKSTCYGHFFDEHRCTDHAVDGAG